MTAETVWYITGASRGIGLELTRQVISSPSAIVLAAVRDPKSATALQGLTAKGKLHIVQINTSDEESIVAAAAEAEKLLDGKGIDYLLNNAAISTGDDRAFKFDVKNLNSCFATNVVGPALVGREFVHLVEKSEKKTIVNFTSGLSSMALDHGPQITSYSLSKTGVNMLTYKQAKEKPSLTVVALDPGWVRTDMGGPDAWLSTEEAVGFILHTVSALKPEQSGKFIDNKGEIQPW
ncbi:NAD(P)-binding protein [Sistotremastrum niveocremeum HHB9708]|uniref:NAD(P)-binding protein n=1 Tax=Sistotremastrum niveocremeum HHB9708 TaxID=1314777 RepID=A0A164XT51_9AGAM|nr:NAD(P)-binding protein [Sistotremastrum niveocremeum HHB9708]